MKHLKRYNELFINSTTVPPGHLINEPLNSRKIVDYAKQFLPQPKETVEQENYDDILEYFQTFKERVDEDTIVAIIDKKWGFIPKKDLVDDIIILFDNID